MPAVKFIVLSHWDTRNLSSLDAFMSEKQMYRPERSQSDILKEVQYIRQTLRQ